MAIGYEDQPPPPQHSIRRAKEAIPVASNSHWLLCSRGDLTKFIAGDPFFVWTFGCFHCKQHPYAMTPWPFSKQIGPKWVHPTVVKVYSHPNISHLPDRSAGQRWTSQEWTVLSQAPQSKGSVVPNWKRESCGVIFTCLDFLGGRIREFGLLFGC